MAETTFSEEPPPPLNFSFDTMNPSFLSHQDLTFSDPTDPNFGVSLEDIDFDITIDDLDLLPFNDFLSQDEFYAKPTSIHPQNALKSTSPEFLNQESSPTSSNHSRVLNSSQILEDFQNCVDVSSYLNAESPENHRICIDQVMSPESNGSNKDVNCAVLEDSEDVSVAGSNKSANSVSSSPNFDQKVKLEGCGKKESDCNGDRIKNCLLKRKQGSEDSSNDVSNVEIRTNKYHKLSGGSSNSGGEDGSFVTEEGKRKARLVRNRESAHLSRQRKKQYVEELEDKVKAMHSMIHDLNTKVSYIMAENVTLRQQMGGGGAQPMAPPPGMYPAPTMMYPWMPAPHYIVKQHGSQVPLVPIPRLKVQQSVSVPKTSKKAESKKSEGKSKKVASVSFLGLLFFMMLFGGLVPMVNVRNGGMKDVLVGGSERNGFYERHHGRVLAVNGNGHGENFHGGPDVNSNVRGSQEGYGREPNTKHAGNGSEPLMASLYVPRNDKLVKIDGNLIIHSVLASDKAMASHENNKVRKSDETGLAFPGDVASSIPKRNTDRHPHLALGSGSENENKKSTTADHSLQQWFREGLAGPMLSSGMCTEVFQFEVASASGAIIPSTSSTNVTAEDNSTRVSKGVRNRRILHSLPIPLPGLSPLNISEDRTRGSGKTNYTKADSSASSMVVSVLVDPREAADSEGDGVMGQKSLSRIFVVVLIDSVKYVTYSCMLPFKGSFPHLVTT